MAIKDSRLRFMMRQGRNTMSYLRVSTVILLLAGFVLAGTSAPHAQQAGAPQAQAQQANGAQQGAQANGAQQGNGQAAAAGPVDNTQLTFRSGINFVTV